MLVMTSTMKLIVSMQMLKTGELSMPFLMINVDKKTKMLLLSMTPSTTNKMNLLLLNVTKLDTSKKKLKTSSNSSLLRTKKLMPTVLNTLIFVKVLNKIFKELMVISKIGRRNMLTSNMNVISLLKISSSSFPFLKLRPTNRRRNSNLPSTTKRKTSKDLKIPSKSRKRKSRITWSTENYKKEKSEKSNQTTTANKIT